MAEEAVHKTSGKQPKEAEHFSLKDLEAFVEIAELVEAAVQGRIKPEELEEKLTARVMVSERKTHAAA